MKSESPAVRLYASCSSRFHLRARGSRPTPRREHRERRSREREKVVNVRSLRVAMFSSFECTALLDYSRKKADLC